MTYGYNYASSAEQQRQELLRMYLSLTDPREKKRLAFIRKRDQRKQQIKLDTGI